MIEISGLQTNCAVNAITEFLRKDGQNARSMSLVIDYGSMEVLSDPGEISNYLLKENVATEFAFAVEMQQTDQSFFVSTVDDKITVGVLIGNNDGKQVNPYWDDGGIPSSARHFKELAISRYFNVKDNTVINLRFESREDDMSETYVSTWKDLMDGVPPNVTM